ncbi:MAG: sigma-54-dependent Fis family transcriptional regulator [Acidobacteria bacterium]|nr:sigma-54-dependent Fis family transcriptional regulator [Acidobacteriota bacterium]
MSALPAVPFSPAPVSRPSRSKIFIFEPNVALLDYIRATMGDHYALHLFSETSSILRDLEIHRPDLILIAWDGMATSLQSFTQIREASGIVPIVLLSTTANVEELSPVIRLGAQGFILKPFQSNDLRETVEKYLSVPCDTETAIQEDAKETAIGEGRYFVRSSKKMRDVENQAALVAQSEIPVLILGESGTGKEVMALFVHNSSPRRNNTFLKINCAAMPAELLESELFGHEQGAFTGAYKAKPGKFETCAGGTIFLDEIGEMPVVLQAKLLHVLQDGTFSRLGSRNVMKADVRVIAATNINIKEAIANRTFREDLYYRLNGFSLTLPPLRERREEIPLLASYFMRRSSEKYGRPALSFSPVLRKAMLQHSWPGNLRELENIVNRYLILGEEQSVISELEPSEHHLPSASPSHEMDMESGLKDMVRSVKGDAEAAVIARALEETGWNRKAAAQNLKISYKALLYKIKNYRLTPRNRN